MQYFKSEAKLLLGYFWLVDYDYEEDLLIIKDSLATAEVSAGAVAKADQYIFSQYHPH